MTLDTQMRIRTDQTPAQVHAWINANLLATEEIPEPEVDGSPTDDGSIWNRGGQGLSAWLITKPLPAAETWEDYREDDADYYDSLSAEDLADAMENFAQTQAGKTYGSVLVSFDTAYGYTGPNGESCTVLHAKYLLALLNEYGEDSVAWQNEYSGHWTIGWDADAISGWLGNGDSAMDWFGNVAMPAIQKEIEGR